MPEAPYQLDLRRAQLVLIAIRETCRYRDWDLIAAHIRTTHIHLIVDRLEKNVSQSFNANPRAYAWGCSDEFFTAS